jgi:hypothetical protein
VSPTIVSPTMGVKAHAIGAEFKRRRTKGDDAQGRKSMDRYPGLDRGAGNPTLWKASRHVEQITVLGGLDLSQRTLLFSNTDTSKCHQERTIVSLIISSFSASVCNTRGY